PLGFAGARYQILLRGDHWLNRFLAEPERGIEVCVVDFLGRALKHHQVGFVADIDQVEIAVDHLSMGWVGDKLAVYTSDAHSAERAFPGNIADHKRRGSADDGKHVRVIFTIRAEDDALDLDL